jgi:hypothetical protein
MNSLRDHWSARIVLDRRRLLLVEAGLLAEQVGVNVEGLVHHARTRT